MNSNADAHNILAFHPFLHKCHPLNNKIDTRYYDVNNTNYIDYHKLNTLPFLSTKEAWSAEIRLKAIINKKMLYIPNRNLNRTEAKFLD